MARMIYPPYTWNVTTNVIDTVIVNYTSTYPAVNLTLFCETVSGTGNWIWWDLEAPLPANGTYNLRLPDYNFPRYINVFPTECHIDIINSRNNTQRVNGGRLPLGSTTNVRATTFALSSTGTAFGTAVSSEATSTTVAPIGSGSGSGATSATMTGPATATPQAADSGSGLSSSTRIGIGVGVGVGGLILIVLAAWAILMYRKRRRGRDADLAQTTDGKQRYEKAELLGNPVSQQYNELPSGSHNYPSSIQKSQLGSPQELAASTTHPAGHNPNLQPPQRYELGP